MASALLIGFTDVLLFLAGQFEHFILYLLEVFLRKRLSAQVNIIIKTRFDGWPNAELHARIQGFQRFGQ